MFQAKLVGSLLHSCLCLPIVCVIPRVLTDRAKVFQMLQQVAQSRTDEQPEASGK